MRRKRSSSSVAALYAVDCLRRRSTMDRRRGPAAREFEDFDPVVEWKLAGEDQDVVEISLPGFRKDQVRVQVDNQGVLRATGERPARGGRWARFKKDLRLPDNCDADAVRARFEGEKLVITLPVAAPADDGTAAGATPPGPPRWPPAPKPRTSPPFPPPPRRPPGYSESTPPLAPPRPPPYSSERPPPQPQSPPPPPPPPPRAYYQPPRRLPSLPRPPNEPPPPSTPPRRPPSPPRAPTEMPPPPRRPPSPPPAAPPPPTKYDLPRPTPPPPGPSYSDPPPRKPPPPPPPPPPRRVPARSELPAAQASRPSTPPAPPRPSVFPEPPPAPAKPTTAEPKPSPPHGTPTAVPGPIMAGRATSVSPSFPAPLPPRQAEEAPEKQLQLQGDTSPAPLPPRQAEELSEKQLQHAKAPEEDSRVNGEKGTREKSQAPTAAAAATTVPTAFLTPATEDDTVKKKKAQHEQPKEQGAGSSTEERVATAAPVGSDSKRAVQLLDEMSKRFEEWCKLDRGVPSPAFRPSSTEKESATFTKLTTVLREDISRAMQYDLYLAAVHAVNQWRGGAQQQGVSSDGTQQRAGLPPQTRATLEG